MSQSVPGTEDAEERLDLDPIDITTVMWVTVEPSYVSEIARKLRDIQYPVASRSEEGDVTTWDEIAWTEAIRLVSFILRILNNDDRVKLVNPDMAGQRQGSPKRSMVDASALIDEDQFSDDELEDVENWWNLYTIAYDPKGINIQNVGGEIREVINPDITLQDKIDIVSNLSRVGNEIAMDSEAIAKDVLRRQFRDYDVVETTGYNDPGLDFYVEDEDRRDYGLSVEISTRYVNPVDRPYVDAKKDMAFDRDSDLVILAPKFTQNMRDRYEDPDDLRWHSDPLSNMVHLHRVPNRVPDVYTPFAEKLPKGDEEGNPIIIPDTRRVRGWLRERGHVGDEYPIVDDSRSEFRRHMDDVLRNYRVITESRYRNQIRESLEPLFWEFMRPYRIEQFLIDMYWDKGLSQNQIGRLVDRSGSTIGRWMSEQKWDIIRRSPDILELSDRVREIWRRMYLGENPFPEEFSVFRIQAEYNRHPYWDLGDWRNWYERPEEERKDVMSNMVYWRDDLDYTLMFGPEDRLIPSYSFIVRTLRDMGVDIRPTDEAPDVPYSAYPSRGTLEYMINRNESTIVETEEE